MKNFSSESGYTLIELLVTLAITGVLLSFITMNLVKVQHNTSLSTSEEMIIADIKSQQMKAMQGTENGGNFGVHFSSNNTYTLFQGSSFATATSTTPMTIDGPITFSSGSDIVFDSLTGEIHGYASPFSITVTNTAGGEQKTITLNKYGVVTQD